MAPSTQLLAAQDLTISSSFLYLFHIYPSLITGGYLILGRFQKFVLVIHDSPIFHWKVTWILSRMFAFDSVCFSVWISVYCECLCGSLWVWAVSWKEVDGSGWLWMFFYKSMADCGWLWLLNWLWEPFLVGVVDWKYSSGWLWLLSWLGVANYKYLCRCGWFRVISWVKLACGWCRSVS